MKAGPGIETAVHVFVGYLMLDAWIANQDRHHENWGLVVSSSGAVHLAPTYDHASSLGRNETDEARKDRLTTRDRGRSMERYVARATSAFYASLSSRKALSTIDAFRNAAKRNPAAAQAWLQRLEEVDLRDTRSLLERVPPDRISDVAVDFAQKMLELNYYRLLALKET
jgi:serine/threonine protein kinase HipA of HipAB toxin-antitoxin module